MASTNKIHVLFVCLGNICRSPLAEGIFRHQVRAAGLTDRFVIDSAGTASYHVGDPPDDRTTKVARARGVELTSRARQIGVEDLARFDYVVAMDSSNLKDIRRLVGATAQASLHMLREFDPIAKDDLDVPDPYYGGGRGFEIVHDMVERSCTGLLDHIRAERKL